MRAHLFFILSTCILLCQCGTQEHTESVLKKTPENIAEISKNSYALEVVRLEQALWMDKSAKGVEKLFREHPVFARKFIRVQDFPSASELYKNISKMIMHPAMDTVYQTTQNVFGDARVIIEPLQTGYEHIKAFDPRFKFPPIYTFITGFGKDMMVSDSLIVISLEFFLSENCRYKPDLPMYILKRYRPEYIAPMILSALSAKYIRTDMLDNTLVSDMIYFGKMYYFLEKMLPGLPDSILTGYSTKDLDEIQKNESIIWAHFVNNKLLYETKHEITNKYIGERPNVYEIGNKCPGRIGRWLGWKIIRAYMRQNPGTTLTQLLTEKDAKKIFIASKYKPK